MRIPESTVLMHRSILFFILILLGGTSCCVGQSVSTNQHPAEPVEYEVLEDDNGTIVKIGVKSNISENQLRATLTKASNDAQNNKARDYMFSPYLWIEAYLVENGKKSSIPAGRLRKYIPPKNLDYREEDNPIFVGKDDLFEISLENAHRSIK